MSDLPKCPTNRVHATGEPPYCPVCVPQGPVTPAQNAQVPCGCGGTLVQCRLCDGRGWYPERRTTRDRRSALLAEWSAGEGLDFEAAYYANVQKIAEDKHQAAIWWRAFVANHHLAGALDALDRQHRARVGALRARIAELEGKPFGVAGWKEEAKFQSRAHTVATEQYLALKEKVRALEETIRMLTGGTMSENAAEKLLAAIKEAP